MQIRRTRKLAAAGAIAVAVSALPATSGSAAGAPAVFAPVVTYPTGGTSPVALVAADFDRDGRADLLAADYPDRTVAVLRANGDGSFGAPRTFATNGGGPEGVAAGDLNRDGNVDAVVADISGTVAVLLGSGTGALGPAAAFPAGGGGTMAVVVDDLDRDLVPDVAVANNGSGTIAVLAGNGDGTLAPATTYPVGYPGSRPVALGAGDVNGDGNLDLVAAATSSSTGTVSVLLGRGDGTFQPAATVGSGGVRPDSVAVGDLNADGKADVAVTNVAMSGTVAVLAGDGLGGFVSQSILGTGGATPRGVAIADLSGDGVQDIVATNGGSATIGVLSGNGDGTFAAPATFASGGGMPLAVVVTDASPDGSPDLAVANASGANVGVLLNTSSPAPVPTATALASSVNPSTWGEAVTFTATVTSASPGAPVPTGTVQFTLDGVPLGGPVELAAGQATSPQVAGLAAGGHEVRAAYAGDARSEPSASAPLAQAVVYGIKWVSPAAGGTVWPGSAVNVRFVATDASGAPIPDALATALVQASPCGAVFEARGVQATGPVCMKYDSYADRFTRLWWTGWDRGAEQITATLRYPNTPIETTATQSFTFGW